MPTHRSIAMLSIAVALSACSGGGEPDPASTFIALLIGSVLVILLVGSLGCSLYTAMIVGGALNLKINLTSPTPKSRRWGWGFGIVNVLNGLLGVFFIVRLTVAPSDDPPDAEVWLYVLAGTAAALGVGIGGIVAAVRAGRRESWEDPESPPGSDRS